MKRIPTIFRNRTISLTDEILLIGASYYLQDLRQLQRWQRIGWWCVGLLIGWLFIALLIWVTSSTDDIRQMLTGFLISVTVIGFALTIYAAYRSLMSVPPTIPHLAVGYWRLCLMQRSADHWLVWDALNNDQPLLTIFEVDLPKFEERVAALGQMIGEDEKEFIATLQQIHTILWQVTLTEVPNRLISPRHAAAPQINALLHIGTQQYEDQEDPLAILVNKEQEQRIQPWNEIKEIDRFITEPYEERLSNLNRQIYEIVARYQRVHTAPVREIEQETKSSQREQTLWDSTALGRLYTSMEAVWGQITESLRIELDPTQDRIHTQMAERMDQVRFNHEKRMRDQENREHQIETRYKLEKEDLDLELEHAQRSVHQAEEEWRHILAARSLGQPVSSVHTSQIAADLETARRRVKRVQDNLHSSRQAYLEGMARAKAQREELERRYNDEIQEIEERSANEWAEASAHIDHVIQQKQEIETLLDNMVVHFQADTPDELAVVQQITQLRHQAVDTLYDQIQTRLKILREYHAKAQVVFTDYCWQFDQSLASGEYALPVCFVQHKEKDKWQIAVTATVRPIKLIDNNEDCDVLLDHPQDRALWSYLQRHISHLDLDRSLQSVSLQRREIQATLIRLQQQGWISQHLSQDMIKRLAAEAL